MADCPICLEPFSAERLPIGCPTVCAHTFCEPCGNALRDGTPPFRCAICRADYTEWFIDRFCWMPPGYIEGADFHAFMEAALAAFEAQGVEPELLEIGRRIMRLT